MSDVQNGDQALIRKGRPLTVCPLLCPQHKFVCTNVQGETKKCELLCNCKDFIFQWFNSSCFHEAAQSFFESMRKEITLSEGESELTPIIENTAQHSGLFATLPLTAS